MTFSTIRQSFFSRFISVCLMITFVGTMVITPRAAFAGGVMGLPEPGTMVNLSPAYVPLMITGLTVHPENPLLMDFIVSTGNTGMNAAQVKIESDRLIKYFLACLTIPENNQWVNLSPYEKQRIIPEDLGQTVLGQDMLAQDYLLKQLTASLIYPEKNLGKDFWDKVYAKAGQMYGTTQIPVNTFNKVWILPDTAKVYGHNNTVFVVKCHLKVMLDEDYLALHRHSERSEESKGVNNLGSNIIRQIILPAIEKEVNTGKNFAQLRQIYNSMILAFWYKNNLKQALLNQVYTNRSKVNGVNVDDPAIKQKIYEQYVQAYKKGVFNYIKEDVDQTSQEIIPRKYFSGGIRAITGEQMATKTEAMSSVLNGQSAGSVNYDLTGLSVGMQPGSSGQVTAAMRSQTRLDQERQELNGVVAKVEEVVERINQQESSGRVFEYLLTPVANGRWELLLFFNRIEVMDNDLKTVRSKRSELIGALSNSFPKFQFYRGQAIATPVGSNIRVQAGINIFNAAMSVNELVSKSDALVDRMNAANESGDYTDLNAALEDARVKLEGNPKNNPFLLAFRSPETTKSTDITTLSIEEIQSRVDQYLPPDSKLSVEDAEYLKAKKPFSLEDATKNNTPEGRLANEARSERVADIEEAALKAGLLGTRVRVTNIKRFSPNSPLLYTEYFRQLAKEFNGHAVFLLSIEESDKVLLGDMAAEGTSFAAVRKVLGDEFVKTSDIDFISDGGLKSRAGGSTALNGYNGLFPSAYGIPYYRRAMRLLGKVRMQHLDYGKGRLYWTASDRDYQVGNLGYGTKLESELQNDGSWSAIIHGVAEKLVGDDEKQKLFDEVDQATDQLKAIDPLLQAKKFEEAEPLITDLLAQYPTIKEAWGVIKAKKLEELGENFSHPETGKLVMFNEKPSAAKILLLLRQYNLNSIIPNAFLVVYDQEAFMEHQDELEKVDTKSGIALRELGGSYFELGIGNQFETSKSFGKLSEDIQNQVRAFHKVLPAEKIIAGNQGGIGTFSDRGKIEFLINAYYEEVAASKRKEDILAGKERTEPRIISRGNVHIGKNVELRLAPGATTVILDNVIIESQGDEKIVVELSDNTFIQNTVLRLNSDTKFGERTVILNSRIEGKIVLQPDNHDIVAEGMIFAPGQVQDFTQDGQWENPQTLQLFSGEMAVSILKLDGTRYINRGVTKANYKDEPLLTVFGKKNLDDVKAAHPRLGLNLPLGKNGDWYTHTNWQGEGTQNVDVTTAKHSIDYVKMSKAIQGIRAEIDTTALQMKLIGMSEDPAGLEAEFSANTVDNLRLVYTSLNNAPKGSPEYERAVDTVMGALSEYLNRHNSAMTSIIYNDGKAAVLGEATPQGELYKKAGMAFIFGTGNNGTAIDEHGNIITDDSSILELGHNILRNEHGQWRFTGKEARGGKPVKAKGDTSFEEEFSGLSIARRFTKYTYADKLVDGFLYNQGKTVGEIFGLINENIPDSQLARKEKQKEAINILLKAITESLAAEETKAAETQEGPGRVSDFVNGIGEEIGQALSALFNDYIDQPWVENFIMVSGVGENFAKIEGRTGNNDVFVAAIRNGVRKGLIAHQVDFARADKVASGVRRSNISWQREAYAAALTEEDIRKAALPADAQAYSIGYSIGGTKIGVALLDKEGNAIASNNVEWAGAGKVTAVTANGFTKEFVQLMVKLAQGMLVAKGVQKDEVIKAGIAFASQVNEETGVIGEKFAPERMPLLKGVNLPAVFQEAWANSAMAAAVSHWEMTSDTGVKEGNGRAAVRGLEINNGTVKHSIVLQKRGNELIVFLDNRRVKVRSNLDLNATLPEIINGIGENNLAMRATLQLERTLIGMSDDRARLQAKLAETPEAERRLVYEDLVRVLPTLTEPVYRGAARTVEIALYKSLPINKAMSADEAIAQVETWATANGWDDTVVKNVRAWRNSGAVNWQQWNAFIRIVEEGKADKIKAGFSSQLGVLQPGTAGTRGEMENFDEDKIGPNYFSRTTVIQYTLSFVNWYTSTEQKGPVFIAKEVRENSDAFGDVAANILLANKIPVIRIDQPVSTPFASYLAKWLGTTDHGKPAFGFQISASHNKFADNGIKFMGPDGQQFMPNVMNPIAAGIPSLASVLSPVPNTDLKADPNYHELTAAELSQSRNAYFDEIDATLSPDAKDLIRGLKEKGKKFVFTPLNGASAEETILYLKRFGLEEGVDYLIPPDDKLLPNQLSAERYADKKLNNSDPAREGAPAREGVPATEGVLDSTKRFADEHGIDLVFARDPDGDRLVLATKINGNWTKLNGNQNAIVMLHDRLSHSGDLDMSKMLIMRSHATTEVLDKIAEDFKAKMVVVPVGFKYFGGKILDVFKGTPVGRYFFGAEESYGTSNGHINEKDGLSGIANMLVIIARLEKEGQGRNVSDYLNELYMKYGYAGDLPDNIPLPGNDKPAIDAARGKVIASLMKKKPGDDLAGYEIESIKTNIVVEGLEGEFHDGYDLILKDTSGQKFRLLFRASGTEPIFKSYFSWQNPKTSTSLDELNGIIADTDAYAKAVSQNLREAFKVMAGNNAMSSVSQYIGDDDADWGAPTTEDVFSEVYNAAMIVEPGQESTMFIERPSSGKSKIVTVVGSPHETYTISVHPTKEDELIVYPSSGKPIEARFGSSTISVLAAGGVFDVIDDGDRIRIKNYSRGSQLEITDKAGLTRVLPVEASPLRGGIDLNSRNLKMESFGQKVNITFNQAMIAQFQRGDFSGVRINILDVVPVDLMPLLGLNEN